MLRKPHFPLAATTPKDSSLLLDTQAHSEDRSGLLPHHFRHGLQGRSSATAPERFGALSFISGLYLFFVFSHAAEFIDSRGRFHLVTILAVVACIATVFGGRLLFSLTSRPGLFLSAFTASILLGIPFSLWKGGSFHEFVDLWWKSYLTFILVSGLTFSLKQLRRAFLLLALASVCIVYLALIATRSYADGRISVTYGSLGNSNDLAASLLMCLPFVIYTILDNSRSVFIRLPLVGTVGLLLITVVKTGSRASLLVLAAMLSLVFLKAGAANKAKLIGCVFLIMCAFPFVVSRDLISRYKTTFSSTEHSDSAVSALESTEARKELMRNALTLTFRHPVFGVGLGNFYMQSANLEMERGNQPLWFTCHNIFLLISSETGLLGFCLFSGTIVSALTLLLKIQRLARRCPGLAEGSRMAFCLTMSFFAYVASGLFNTNCYGMQLPALVGLTVVLSRIANSSPLGAANMHLQTALLNPSHGKRSRISQQSTV